MKAYADITTSALGISHKDRWITKVNWVKNLLYSTGNSAQYSGITCVRNEPKQEGISV